MHAPWKDSFLDRETIPVCHVFEEIFLGLLLECCKIFLGGGRGAWGLWVSGRNRSNGDASDQTGTSVCARDENGIWVSLRVYVLYSTASARGC